MVDALPNMVFEADAQGRNTWSSAAWTRYTGLTAQALAQEGWQHVIHPQDMAASHDAWLQSLATGAEFTSRRRIRRFDGQWRWHLVRVVPLRDTGGAITAWVGSATDIDNEVQAEAARAASEAHLRAVLDALPTGVVIADAQGTLLHDNAAHRALWGMEPEVKDWTQYGQWEGYWPESGQRLRAEDWAMSRALRHGEVVRGELVECQPFHGGPRRHYFNNAAPVRDASGAIVGGVVVELDVTAQRAAELERTELLAAETAARARVEQLQSFTAALSRARSSGDVARATIEAGAQVLGACCGSLYRLVNGERPLDTLELVAAFGYEGTTHGQWRRVPVALSTPMGDAVRQGQPMIVGHAAALVKRYPALRPLVEQQGYHGTAVYPLPLSAAAGACAAHQSGVGSVRGAVGFDFDRDRDLTTEEDQFLQTLAQLCAQALERTQAAEAERRMRQQLESVLGAISDAFLTLDCDWHVTHANARAQALLCQASVPLLGRSLWEACTPLVGTALEHGLRRAMATGVPVAFEAHYPLLQGWLDVRAYPSEQGLAVYLHDITARREAVARLQASQAQLQAIFDAAPVGLFFAEAPSGRIVKANAQAEEILGHPALLAQDIQAYTQYAAFHADGRPVQPGEYPMARALAGEARPALEVLYRRGDGRMAWVRTIGAPIRDEQGTVTGALVALMDIDRKRRAIEALTQTQLRLDMALAVGRMGVWDYAPATGELRWSRQMFDLLGVPERADGLVSADVFTSRIHPDDRAAFDAALAQALAECGALETEVRLVRGDGQVRWILGRGSVMCDAQGQAARMVGVNVDITERKAAEQALFEADQRRNEFLAMLGHELRNPLAPIANAVHLLEKTHGDTAVGYTATAVQIIRRQSAHLARLVDDLLEVSRVTQGRIELRKENVLAATAVLSAVESVRPLVRAQRQTLDIDVPAHIDLVADPARLTQIVANLLNNAAKYTPAGGHIDVRARADDEMVNIEVADDGLGIDAQLLPRVFDLFAQGASTLERSRGGLGLGLALVKRLVELHGGTVHALSAGPGQGSTFTVRLPRSERRHTPRSPAVGLPAKVLAPTSILVVDDNSDAAQSLALLLEADGHRVKVAHDGLQALEAARGLQPKVVLLDLALPQMDGYAVARALRSDAELAAAVIVALSGYGQAEDRERSRDAGFDAHLLKPVELAALYRTVAHVLESR